jgi:protein arginine N-methyltransferase 1
MYSVAGYSDMIWDKGRMDPYAAALRAAIAPGATVVDIGTGTGIMAFLACAYGAAVVYAIEPADVIEIARAIARANALTDRIRFIQKPSTTVMLPEPADVVVSDLRGVLPLFQRHVPSVIDARRRLLRPGGTLVPRRDVIQVAVAGSSRLYERYVAPWARNDYGIDMSVVGHFEANTWRQCRARPGDIVLAPQELAVIDYATVDEAGMSGRVQWTASATTEAHGLIAWFDADLGGGVGFSNAPGAPELIYGQAFFPWPHAVRLIHGDTLAVRITAVLVGEDYVWTWKTRITDETGARKANFHQSTFFGVPRSPESLARRSADHVPSLNEEGRLDRLILELLEQGMPLGRIADEVFAKFPGSLPTRARALDRVGDLSARYGGGPP